MASVLHVVSYFPPDRIGGVGEVVANVHQALLRAGHRSTVLTTGTSTSDPHVRRIARTPAGFALACARHVRLAQAADVIHIHHGEGLALLALLRVVRARVPVLLTLHVGLRPLRHSLAPYEVAGRQFARGGLRDLSYRALVVRVREWMDAAALALADRVNFISKSAAADVLGVTAAESACVIYNGVTHPAPSLAPATPLLPVELLYVGTNSPRKRVELLPLVLARVRLSQPSARLRIVGFTAEENSELIGVAKELAVLEAIEFAGRKRSDELPSYYQAAKVLLVPSAYEGLPMVILAASQESLPAVATRVSGHPEVIEHGRSGLLVDVDAPDQMADAAVRLLAEPALAAQMGARARTAVAQRFDADRQAQAYLALYTELRAGHSDRASSPSAGALP